MDENITLYIMDVGDELRGAAVEGSAQYDGRWVTLAQWVDAVVEQDARKFANALREHLDSVVSEIEAE